MPPAQKCPDRHSTLGSLRSRPTRWSGERKRGQRNGGRERFLIFDPSVGISESTPEPVLKTLGWPVRKVAGSVMSATRAGVPEPCQVSDPVGRPSRIGVSDDCPRGHIIRFGSDGIPGACRGASKTVAVGTGIGLSPDLDSSKPDKDLSGYPRLAAAKTWQKQMLKSSRNPFSC